MLYFPKLFLVAILLNVSCSKDFEPVILNQDFPKNYVCYRTSEPIEIDGKDNELAWKKAPQTDDFMDIEGDSKPKPSFRTYAKMLWDDEFFYCFAKMEEPHIWAAQTERDAVIYHDDDFEIFIDPNGDGHNYYEFEINAFNTLWDLFLLYPYHLKKHPNYLINWTVPDVKTAVHIEGTVNDPTDEDEFWSVEFAIPWGALKELSGLRKLPKSGNQWRINFSRVDWEMKITDQKYVKKKSRLTGKKLPENNWVWAPTGRIDMHRPEEWGFVQFSEKIVGEDEDYFIPNPEESVKKALWKLYYQQRLFYKKNGFYSDDLNDFEMPISVECDFQPEIFVTPNLFEIVTKSCSGKGTWRIQQNGKIDLN